MESTTCNGGHRQVLERRDALWVAAFHVAADAELAIRIGSPSDDLSIVDEAERVRRASRYLDGKAAGTGEHRELRWNGDEGLGKSVAELHFHIVSPCVERKLCGRVGWKQYDKGFGVRDFGIRDIGAILRERGRERIQQRVVLAAARAGADAREIHRARNNARLAICLGCVDAHCDVERSRAMDLPFKV